jgi:alpha-tubulin suppressor-like RCC1 family protein
MKAAISCRLGHAAAAVILALSLASCVDRAPTAPANVSAALSVAAGSSLPALAAGGYHTCALSADDSVACWGANGYGQSSVPAGSYTQVSAGYFHTCAVRTEGSLACWGQNEKGQSSPPPGEFVQVSAGTMHSCALTKDGDATCWGWNYDGETGGPPSTEAPFSATFTREGPFTQVSAGLYHSCALGADGTITCWGVNDLGSTTPPPGVYTQVSATWYRTCALRADGAVVCFGNNGNGQGTSPEGPFTQVSAAGFHTCAVRADGDIQCWGNDGYGQVSGTPHNGDLTFTHAGPFTQVAAGMFHTCAVKPDGALTCWGAGTTNTGIEPHFGQAAPPQLQASQAIVFTSTPPSPALLGGSYSVNATGGGSGNPVVFSSLTSSVCSVAPSSGSSVVSLSTVGTCTVAADQAGNASYLPAPRVTQSFPVVFAFGGSTGGGFAPPVSSTTFNSMRAGQSVPVKFDLGGDQGLFVVASGYPQSRVIGCPNGGDLVNLVPEATATAGASELTYSATTGLYTYVWKTDRAWAGTCREFVLRLSDDTEHRASFQFAR